MRQIVLHVAEMGSATAEIVFGFGSGNASAIRKKGPVARLSVELASKFHQPEIAS